MSLRSEWSQVEALFDAAWELPAAERIGWLQAQDVRPDLVDRAIELIQAVGDSGDFLQETTARPVERRRAALTANARVGAWRVVRPIGRGGMGEVYEVARDDGQFAQRAALKVIAHSGRPSWERFQIERQILARLDHPGIARLIDGGLLDVGRPYMVMEFVDGEPIDTFCERNGLDLAARVDLIIQMCDALAHAHAQLVVHSDLKPSNILVDRQGRPRLIDFGVAHLADASDPTGRAAPLSPDYAAPEQLGAGHPTMATDTHGLAATLYRLVAGVPPRQVGGLAIPVAIARILAGDPVRVGLTSASRRWRSSLAERALLDDLDSILAKALQSAPAARYPTAQALSSELFRASERRIVDARRHQRRHVVARTIHRHRWATAGVAAVVSSLAIGLGMALVQAGEVRLQRDESLREQARLQAVQQSVFHMFRSAGELKGGDATAADVLDNAAQRIQDEFARDPARGAPVLHALGELYFLITDYEAAMPLLDRLATADDTVVDPALIAAGRYDLAQVMFRQGNAERAGKLLSQAQSFWRQDDARWASRLIDSRLLEAQLLRERGDTAAAIALLESALARRIAISGQAHRETGVFHNNLGVAFFSAGDFSSARAAFQAASDVWQRTGLQQSPDALNTLNNWGAVEIADDRPEWAEPLLREATTLRRRYFGPSAATAAALSNYGKLLLARQRADTALPVLLEAADMGRQFAGQGSMHHVAALSGVAEAELELSRLPQAQVTADAALAASIDTLGRDHPATAMASIALARVRAEQGRTDEASRLLAEAERIAGAAGAGGARLLAQSGSVRDRYRLAAMHPAPDTATPSP